MAKSLVENIESMTARERLIAMLGYMRPASSRGERKFINRFIRPLGVRQDEAGNLIRLIGDAPRVLWSSHTDTVHRHSGRQLLTFQTLNGDEVVSAPQSNCLGGDCTVGVWLMTEMMRRNVPGLYVFHRAEEIGGIGSSFIAKETPELVAGIDIAIAFDRYGTSSVITHQGHRTCSDAFADSLIAQLHSSFERDDGGTFTDTANYTDIIAECTNISVGYYNQHRSTETQNVSFALDLLEVICEIDQDKLIVERVPGTYEYDSFGWYSQNRYYTPPGRASTSYHDLRDDDEYDRFDRTFMKPDNDPVSDLKPMGAAARQGRDYDYLVDLCSTHPDAVAMLLQDMNVTSDDLLAYIFSPSH